MNHFKTQVAELLERKFECKMDVENQTFENFHGMVGDVPDQAECEYQPVSSRALYFVLVIKI